MNKCWGACCGMFVVLGTLGCDSEPLFDTTDEPSGRAMVVRTTEGNAATDSVPPATETEEEPQIDWDFAGEWEIPAHWPAVFTNNFLREMELLEIMLSVVDDATAQAAVEPLNRLTTNSRGTTKALWLWLATDRRNQSSRLIEESRELGRERYPEGTNVRQAMEIAKRPGNEAFRAAILRYHDQLIDESPPTPANTIRNNMQPLR